MSTSLTVYKASAGSGKTFTLAVEYITLVVKNPQAYRQILAVTFTNKATEEMKMRIMSQLYGIWRQLDSSKDYTDKVCKALDASPEFVAKQAGTALRYILHDYTNFRIGTIDSFFQTILRNLARELELNANLRVGLNDKDVEELAVDDMIENLSTNDAMLKWILRYIMESIDSDRSWNIIGQIKKFGLTIFKEFYKSNSNKLYEAMKQPDFFENFTNELRALQASAEEKAKAIAKEFFSELQGAGFKIEDLSYGTGGVAGVFLKLEKGIPEEGFEGKRVYDCREDEEKWCKKKCDNREALLALVRSKLMPLLERAISEYPQLRKLHQSAELTLKHINQLRLLEHIEAKVRDLNTTANRFLLSDTQQLLHELIETGDSPFIFEKIGTQIEHIMIDEFQDTSTVQWKNFQLLLRETMSRTESANLIVGDVKQSIYRWRSGDWRLLANIRDEFPSKEQMEILPLKTNYRSSRNVVEFNNVFFTKAAESQDIKAYDDVVQLLPEGKPRDGYVNVTLMPAEDYQERVLEAMRDTIDEMLASGVKPSEIAILVRANNQIPLIANYFMSERPDLSIVSDEAFRLDTSTAVQTIVQALRLLIHPNDNIAKAFLAKQYSEGTMLHEMSIDEMLPKAMSEERDTLIRLPLYELTERLYDLFRLQQTKGQSAYLCVFFDIVANFVNERTTDITDFLHEWDETLCSKTIQNAEVSGVRILSIHKSKGLEYQHVIIPFADWKMEHRDILWCSPKEAPFNQLPIVPIDLSQKGMKGTIYESNYDEEHQQNIVDNMNLLYVAFTRAAKTLHVIGRRSASGTRSELIEMTLPVVAEELKDATIIGMESDGDDIVFEFGIKTIAKKEAEEDKKQSDRKLNVFLQDAQPIQLNLLTYSSKVEFRQSNESRNFVLTEDEEIEQASYIQLGSVLHNIFSSIRTTADIDNALKQLELSGIIYNHHLTRERLDKLIRERVSHPKVAEWYSDKWTLFNECTILDVDKESGKVYERRPDRVMTDGNEMIVVDFKFGRQNEDYKKQVRKYMELLEEMGYNNVKGFLWYVYTNKIDEVK
ncbi:MAG: UvrD-helicase domain-containing protein [Prevotella sp.]|nr:UvrD-helicase domain-containing protein [Prevotella sp.]